MRAQVVERPVETALLVEAEPARDHSLGLDERCEVVLPDARLPRGFRRARPDGDQGMGEKMAGEEGLEPSIP